MKMRSKLWMIGSILLLFCFLIFLKYHSKIQSERETRTIDSVQSVENYAYRQTESKKTKLLKNLPYEFRDDVTIPGMPSSKSEDLLNQKIFGESQCPQGICITEEFLLLTSYSEGDDELGELFVFDRESGDYLVTLGMNPKSHLGGVTFDGQNIWICNSESLTIERISYDFVKLMAEQNVGEVVDASEMVDTFEVLNSPSCITYNDGRLWVATHSVSGDSDLVAYHYNHKDDSLYALNQYHIPKKVQGIAFDADGRVYLSTSYGRSSSSYLKIYSSIFAMSEGTKKPQIQVEMPPESEEIAIWDNKIYVLFESAGEKYYNGTDGKGLSVSPIDKILMLSIDSILD